MAHDAAGPALSRPVHFALSYDEEVGCIGVRGLLPRTGAKAGPARRLHRRRADHDGGRHRPQGQAQPQDHRARDGRPLLARAGIRQCGGTRRAHRREDARDRLRLAADGGGDELYDIAHTTAHVGTMHGGTALNIVPDRCEITCEFRVLPEEDADALVDEIRPSSATRWSRR
jgi:acetylornithine deacetylase